MAVKKTNENRVSVTIPRGGPNDEPNVFVSINGVNYLLPRGQTSEVPDFVAAEYYRAEAALAAYYDDIERMTHLQDN